MQKLLTIRMRASLVFGDRDFRAWLHCLNVSGVRSAGGLPSPSRKPSKLSSTLVAFSKLRPKVRLSATYRRASFANADRKVFCRVIADPPGTQSETAEVVLPYADPRWRGVGTPSCSLAIDGPTDRRWSSRARPGAIDG